MKQLVATLFVMAGNAKTAHWNIQGTNFYGIHKVLDEVDATLRDHGDKFAERMRYLGDNPNLSVNYLVTLRDIPSVNPAADIGDQTESVIDGLEYIHEMCETIRGSYDSCEDSMLDVLQEDLGKYIYLLNSMI